MTNHRYVDFEKAVRRIMLDIDLLHWFATHGGRQDTVLGAIAFIRATEDHPVLTFLAEHIDGNEAQH
jgi:hypothetical protein